MNSRDEIEREIGAGQSTSTIFEQGLGLFGSPEDAALLDEVVQLAYEDRRRPADVSAKKVTTPKK